MAPKTITCKSGQTYRPEQLANALGISGKLVRSYLRATFTRAIEAKNTTWVLTSDQAQATVDHFVARRSNVEPMGSSGGGSPANASQ